MDKKKISESHRSKDRYIDIQRWKDKLESERVRQRDRMEKKKMSVFLKIN